MADANDSLQLIVVTPRRQALETAAQWVDVPAESGWMRVLPGHAAALGALGAGLVRYDNGAVVAAGGFFEVRDNRVTLLADLAELPGEINAAAARIAFEKLAPGTAEPLDLALAQARVQATE